MAVQPPDTGTSVCEVHGDMSICVCAFTLSYMQ